MKECGNIRLRHQQYRIKTTAKLNTYLLIVYLQKARLQHEMYVRLILYQLEQIKKRPEHEPVFVAVRRRFQPELQHNTPHSTPNVGETPAEHYQSRRSGHRVGFPAPGLPVTEGGTPEALHRHLYEPLDSGKLQDVLLGGGRLEHHVVREQFRFLAAARAAGDAVALGEEKTGIQ